MYPLAPAVKHFSPAAVADCVKKGGKIRSWPLQLRVQTAP